MVNEKIGRAWIITLESHKNDEKILAVLKYQKSIRQIEEYILCFYIGMLHPSEILLSLSNRGKSGDEYPGLPYPPDIEYRKNSVTIGHEPYLYARQVKNLHVENGKLKWDEMAK